MTSRAQIVAAMLADDGYLDGAGYDGPNKFSSAVQEPSEAWCDDAFTGNYLRCGLRIPSYQAGHSVGGSYVPYFKVEAVKRAAIVNSWLGQPGDGVLLDWQHDGVCDHIETLVRYDRAAGLLYTVGGNSGGSNVPGNPYHGQGGVHQHVWSCPFGVGNPMISAVVDMGKFVAFGADQPPAHPAPVAGVPSWYRDSAGPMTFAAGQKVVRTGGDVELVRRTLGVPSDPRNGYDATTRRWVTDFQTKHGLTPDGEVGPATAAAIEHERAGR